jgi:hypothetical protein
MAISWLKVLLLVLVFVGIIVWSVFRRPGLFVFRGPRKRHILTRIICGTLGAGILVALTVGTLHAVNKTYDPSAFPAVTAHVPTLPPPDITRVHSCKSARLLVQLVLLYTGGGNQVLGVGEMQMRWVEGQICRGETRLTFGQMDHELTAEIWGVSADSQPKKVRVEGTLTNKVLLDQHYASLGIGGFTETGLTRLYQNMPSSGSSVVNMNMHSLWHPHGDNLEGVVVVTLLADDDPLKEVSGEELIAMHEDEMSQIRSAHHMGRSMENRFSMPALGLAAVAYFGLAAISLLAATILLTQLFTRRTLAFAGVMAVVLLYAAAMDRVVLGMNVAHLSDQTAPPAVRIAACRQTVMSFFYGDTALRAIQAVAADPSAPSALQQCAKQETQTIEEYMQSGDGNRS